MGSYNKSAVSFVVIALSLALLVGCTSVPAAPSATPTPVGTSASVAVEPTTSATPTPAPSAQCVQDLSFESVDFPESPVLSGKYEIKAVLSFAPCPSGSGEMNAKVSLYDGVRLISESKLVVVSPSSQGQILLAWSPSYDGEANLRLVITPVDGEEDAGNNERTLPMQVRPIGTTSVALGDSDYYDVSSDNRVAASFDVASSITVKSIEVPIRNTGDFAANLNPQVVFELRPDANGKPSGSVITSQTLGFGDMGFANDAYAFEKFTWSGGITLTPGKYWVVLRAIPPGQRFSLHKVPAVSWSASAHTFGGTAFSETWEATDGTFEFTVSTNP